MAREVKIVLWCDNPVHTDRVEGAREYTFTLGSSSRTFAVCEKCDKSVVQPLAVLMEHGQKPDVNPSVKAKKPKSVVPTPNQPVVKRTRGSRQKPDGGYHRCLMAGCEDYEPLSRNAVAQHAVKRHNTALFTLIAQGKAISNKEGEASGSSKTRQGSTKESSGEGSGSAERGSARTGTHRRIHAV